MPIANLASMIKRLENDARVGKTPAPLTKENVLKIRDSVGFPFRGESAWKNIGLLGVVHAIPVLGPIAVLGYGVMVEKMLVRNIHAVPPTFSFQFFMKYVERGVMPFLVSLVISFGLMFIFVPLSWVVMFAFILVVQNGHVHPLALVGAAVLLFALTVLLSIFLGLITMPFMVRASLLCDFAKSFDFKWALDFIKRVGGSALWALLKMQLVAFPVMMAGLMACYFGMFFTIVMVVMMSWHLQVKLYHLYLDRGGTALDFSDEMLEPSFPLVMKPSPPPVQLP